MRGLKLKVHALFSVLFAAAGVWILMAPTVIGYQPPVDTWVQATYNDVIVGGLLVAVSLAILTAQLITTTRYRLRAAEATEPAGT